MKTLVRSGETAAPQEKTGYVHKKSKWRTFMQNRTLVFMSIPAVLFFLIFCYLPMPGAYIAFVNYNYDLGIFKSPFVGLSNFQFLISSGKLWNITWNTILYNVVFIATSTIAQVAFAIMLNELASKWFKKVSQTIMFLPYFISFVLVGLFLYNYIDYNAGTVNILLQNVGLHKIDFYSTPSVWMPLLTFINLWKGTGYGCVIYLATITSLDTEVIEAAHIDGASAWQRIWYIILPWLKPTVVILTLYAIGGILKGNFQLFYNAVGASNSSLFQATDIIETYVFRCLMTDFNFSLGSAAGLYQSVFGLIIVLLANWAVRKVDPENALF